MRDSWLTFLIFILLCGGLSYFFRDEVSMLFSAGKISADAAKLSDEQLAIFNQVYSRLKIKPLENRLASNKEIAESLKALSEGPCDKTAIFSFANALAGEKEKRKSADALLGFASTCPNSEGELYGAANILFGLGDYAATLPIADQLIGKRPEVGQYYYTRAQTLGFLGKHQEAVEDYTSALGLSDDLKAVSSSVFTGLAESYAATGKACQAMTAIQTYLYADPVVRDTAAVRKLIDSYSVKGNCAAGYAEGSAVISRTNRDVMMAKVSINGMTGNFVVDTGASLVSVDPVFAAKAKILSDNARKMMFHTANGASEAILTSADRVELGKVRADGVAVAVVSKPFGGGIDGLLGMSFLARFDVTLSEKELRIQKRANGAEQAKGP